MLLLFPLRLQPIRLAGQSRQMSCFIDKKHIASVIDRPAGFLKCIFYGLTAGARRIVALSESARAVRAILLTEQ